MSWADLFSTYGELACWDAGVFSFLRPGWFGHVRPCCYCCPLPEGLLLSSWPLCATVWRCVGLGRENVPLSERSTWCRWVYFNQRVEKGIQDILSFRLAVFVSKDFCKWEVELLELYDLARGGRPNEGEWHCPIPTWPHNKNQNTVCFNFRKGCLVDIQMLNFLCILVVLLLPNSWRRFFGKFGEAVGCRNWAKESHNPIRPASLAAWLEQNKWGNQGRSRRFWK